MHVIDVCNEADKVLFEKCLAKLKGIKVFKIEGNVLEDVDESLIAVFSYQETKVTLKNDEQVGALYIESEKNIEHLMYN